MVIEHISILATWRSHISNTATVSCNLPKIASNDVGNCLDIHVTVWRRGRVWDCFGLDNDHPKKKRDRLIMTNLLTIKKSSKARDFTFRPGLSQSRKLGDP